jgi:hypothetical protein
MTIVLKEKEGCPHAIKCKYNKDGSCLGASTDRENIFTCEFVDAGGNIIESGHIRSNLDQTGKMKVIMES